MCRFDSGAMGHMYFSRVATGRKMGYAYEIHGTKGSFVSIKKIRIQYGYIDQKDQKLREVSNRF